MSPNIHASVGFMKCFVPGIWLNYALYIALNNDEERRPPPLSKLGTGTSKVWAVMLVMEQLGLLNIRRVWNFEFYCTWGAWCCVLQNSTFDVKRSNNSYPTNFHEIWERQKFSNFHELNWKSKFHSYGCSRKVFTLTNHL